MPHFFRGYVYSPLDDFELFSTMKEVTKKIKYSLRFTIIIDNNLHSILIFK